MRATLINFIVLFLLFGCENKVEIPNKSKIIAKYVVFEDSISSKIIKDLKKVKEFDKNNKDDKPPFKLDGNFYKVEQEFKLYPAGDLYQSIIHKYHSFNYSDFGLKRIPINSERLGEGFLIKFSPSYKKVIDCDKIFEIEKVFPKVKLLFVKEKRDDGRINIYEYE